LATLPLYPIAFDLWKPSKVLLKTIANGMNTFPAMENGVRFPKCQTCCNTSAARHLLWPNKGWPQAHSREP